MKERINERIKELMNKKKGKTVKSHKLEMKHKMKKKGRMRNN